MTRLKRRPRQRSGIQRVPEKRFPAHRAWVRGFDCVVGRKGHCCNLPMEAAHVRTGTGGGMAEKPHDKWTIPLCHRHHAEQTAIGEAAFERLYGIDMKAIAEGLAARSPHRRGWEDA